MATIGELKTEANGLLKKAAKSTADGDDLLRWFNECRRRLQRRAKIWGTWEVTLTGTTESYSLATASYPIYKLNRVFLIATGAETGFELRILPLHERWEEGIRFKPALPGESNHTLYIWPDTQTGTIELHGERRLSTFTDDDDVPEIPEEFHTLFPLYAVSRYGGQDEDFGGDGRFVNYERQFLQMELDFVQAQNQRTNAHFRTVRLTRGWE